MFQKLNQIIKHRKFQHNKYMGHSENWANQQLLVWFAYVDHVGSLKYCHSYIIPVSYKLLKFVLVLVLL